MSTSNIPPRPGSSDEPIPGYKLIELVGKGGYGEVWKATVPGGVSKAIKLIFDDQPSRSAMELRALNRIKDVRHPFLLSIDRIEHLPGMLAIVTELADRNLQQHCQMYRDKGSVGMPQDELLAMLRDVADVLDFIYQDYALQHLDIKAANLLVFGRRLKVGDFGLVKNIFERTSNLGQAMTPAYAAPEIFAGKPCGTSDQYSLAIVYQEMLTGTLPFNEIAASKLALQHMYDMPNLRSLPAEQQPILARALSKDPQQRFPSCLAFMDELTAACRRSQGSGAETQFGKETQISPGHHNLLETAHRAQPKTPQPQEPATVFPAQMTQPVELPDTAGDHVPPTIVIGLGGSAAHILQQLQQRIADRLGETANPAFRLMLIDSDADLVGEIQHAQREHDPIETVATPLLSAADYRTHGQKHRRWLSRRWLFNIPRSLRTDGLRPLGRLALLSHGPRVKAALRTMIKQLATSASTGIGGQRVAGPPRILFISSISGGTGSGMLLDLAYAARAELQLAGFHQGTVEALLLHSTPIGAERDKAILNAVATLRELAHYSKPGKFYPGEPLMDIPPFHGNNRTFSHVKLMHCGDNLEPSEWRRALDDAAEYAYLRLTTPDSILGKQDHKRPDQPAAAALKIDAIQVRQVGGYAGPFIGELSRQISVDVIRSWCGARPQSTSGSRSSQNATQLIQNILDDDEESRYQQFADDAALAVHEIGVDLEVLVARAREMLHQELTASERSYLQTMFRQAMQASASSGKAAHELAGLVLALQDRAIGLDFGERPSDATRNTLFDLLHSRLASQAMQLAVKFTNWVYDLVDGAGAGVMAARFAADAGRNYLRDLTGSLSKEIHAIHRQQIESRISLTSPAQWGESLKPSRWWGRRSDQNEVLENRLVDHGLACLEELVLVCVQLQLQSIEGQAAAVIDKLLCFEHELKQFERRLATQEAGSQEPTGDAPTGYDVALRQLLLEHRPRLMQELRRQIDQDVLTGPKKLQRFLGPGGSLEQQLWEPLQLHARQIVLNSMRQTLLVLLRSGKPVGDEVSLNLDAALEAQLQEPLILGRDDAAEHAVVIVPSDESAGQLQRRLRRFEQHVSAISSTTNNVTVCREAESIPVYHIAQQIAHHQPTLVQLAENLASRIDVAWEPLAVSPEHAPLDPHPDALPVGIKISETLCLLDGELIESEP